MTSHKPPSLSLSRRQVFGAGLALVLVGTKAQSAPVAYALDAARSVVGFTYRFQSSPTQGTMPVLRADMTLDLDQVPRSQAEVTLDVRNADAGFLFATQTMLGRRVLDAEAHPTIRFVATQFEGDLSGAQVKGALTVRGVTRDVTLQAGLFRQRGTAEGDRSRLSVLLEGQIDRRDFGADGWLGYVDPEIDLRILARLDRVT